MLESRRTFLSVTLPLAAATALTARRVAAQTSPDAPDEPEAPGFGRRRNSLPDVPKFDPKAELKANQDHIKKNVAMLSQLVSDLQKGLSDHDTTEVLSLSVIHKLEEIEKLAKQTRSLVSG